MTNLPTTTRRTVFRTVGHLAACAVFPTLLGAAPARPASAAPAHPGALVMVMRHAEKPTGHGAGIAIDGRSGRHSLTGRGWTRAVYLVDLFTSNGAPGGLPRPSSIYASGPGPGNGEGTRSRETVGPLAAELGIAVNTTFSRGQEADLVAAATARPGPTLICWQHGAIPAIAAAFGQVKPTAPGMWPDNRFDMIWAFTSTGTG
jgi:hypothetical protein